MGAHALAPPFFLIQSAAMPESNSRATLEILKTRKAPCGRICALTAYDAPTARLLAGAGIDILFVGDSVGTNVLGYKTEREVTLADIQHHVAAVRRGAPDAVVLADLPFLTYADPGNAVRNARQLLDAGASLVKVEGADQQKNIEALTQAGITVCAHLGFTPQTLAVEGAKARIQARTLDDARALIDAAASLERAGAAFLVLELVPGVVSELVTRRLGIPTIGIGAGPACDGQVLIVQDVLGMSGLNLRLARKYVDGATMITTAVRAYCADVLGGHFPGQENTFTIDPDIEAALRQEPE